MDSSLVPDVLDKAPSSILTITYPDSLKVAEGNELTPFQSKDQPSVEWKFDTNAFYTLLMIDPDAPSRRFSILGEVNHWLVGNIQGCNIDSGEVIAEYMGPGAPKYTGLHRYIFLLFEHSERIDFKEPKSALNSRRNRLRFSTRNFIKKYHLQNPLAGNFFISQWDHFVDVRNKDISGCIIL